ncbi:EAL domain-containing protein [Butyrivibrio sp. MC2013]|uniref:EAL domain-containing protein n=1 Tax=Butyrivibrio sp. MC2013 TaxID=1280686 RepID=UPI00042261E2|nr:EAL domain-containing protein [Butyrivibrio sp. MC2013]
MIWSLDFDISALAVCLFCVSYYYLGKNLPLRRNRVYLGLLVIQAFFTTFDILGSVTASYPEVFPAWLNYTVNITYYVLFAFCPMFFSLFCYYLISDGQIQRIYFWILQIPSCIIALLSILSPVIHYVFYLDEEGVFHFGPGRVLFYFEALLYMTVTAYMIIRNPRHNLRRRHPYVLLLYIIAALVTYTLQFFFVIYTQTISFGIVIGIAATSMAFQNPDYYREKRTELFNVQGLELYANEGLYYGIKRPFLGFVLSGFNYYEYADSDYYISNMLRQIGFFLKKVYKDNVMFYFDKGVFIIVFKDKSEIMPARDLIRRRFNNPFELENGPIHLDISFFYYEEDISFMDYDDLRGTLNIAIKRAAKLSGDKTLQITEGMHQEAIHIKEMEETLKYALNHDEHVLVYYQPIYSNLEKKFVSAEALVRLYDPVHKRVVFPDDFIPLAEKNGSIMKLGLIVFRKTCEMIKKYDITAYGIRHIEINLSPRQCMYKGLAEDLISIMEEYKMEPDMIGLEITENESIDKLDIRRNIDTLTEYGISFALDDYGTGYANLVNILKGKFDIVKIDKSICWDYFRSGNKLLLEVIEQFLGRGKMIIVEGVEDKEMADTLAELGVQMLQGFYFSKPLPLDEFISYVESKNCCY